MIMSSINRVEATSFNPNSLVRLKDVAKLARRVHHPDSRNFLLRNLQGLEPVSANLTSPDRSNNLAPIEGALNITSTSPSDNLRVHRILNRITELQKQVKILAKPKHLGAEVAEAINVALRAVGKPFSSLSLIEQQALLSELQTAGISTHPKFDKYKSRLSYLETE